MNSTGIEWCDFSSQLIRYRDADGKDVWACAKASPGCANCYAEAVAERFHKGGPFTLAKVRTVTPYFAEDEAKKILLSKKIAGKRIFIGDMTDVFGDWVSDELLDRMFAIFALRPDVTFQVLTKRAKRMSAYFAERWQPGTVEADGKDYKVGPLDREDHVKEAAMKYLFTPLGEQDRFWTPEGAAVSTVTQWPLPNVWLGVSVEDQQRADERIPHLLRTPATVRFLSAEPLLSEVDLWRFLEGHNGEPVGDWVIVGGESGLNSRPCDVDWIRSLVAQCRSAKVACFVKQLGSAPRGDEVLAPTGRFRNHPQTGQRQLQLKVTLKDRKGGNPSEWPADLRVRQFPEVNP